MKKLILLWIIQLSCLTLHAQTPQVETIGIGRDLRTDEILYASCYSMPGLVHMYRAYPENETIVYSLLFTNKKGTTIKPRGTIRGYSLDLSEKRWEEDFKWQSEPVYFDERVVIKRSGNRFSYLFPMSGHELASLSSNPLGYLYSHNIILSSQISDNPRSNVLYGHSMGGEKLWERKVKKNFNWTGYEFIDDSSVIVSGSGLFRIDLSTGEGWELPAITHNADKKARGAFWASVGVAVLSGVTAGVAASATGFGVYVIPGEAMSSPSKLRDISSNICIVDDHVFWAGKKDIYKIDLGSGDVLWQSPLDEKTSSSSYIIPASQFIYMLNTGTVQSYTGEREFGMPYVSKYDSSSGELEFRCQMPAGIRNISWDGEREHMLVFTADNLLNKLSLSSGEITSCVSHENSDSEYFMVRRDVLKKYDSGGMYLPLLNLYPAHTVFISDGSDVFCYDDDLALVDTFSVLELFLPYAEIDSYLLAGNSEINVLINMAFNPVAEFDYPGKFSIADRYLFGVDKKDVYRIDLAQILPVGTDFNNVQENGTEMYPYDVIY